MASTSETITEQPTTEAVRPKKQVRTRIEYRRFNVFHRWMHFLVFCSFTVLVFTGMPLKYKDTAWAQWFMDLFGGVTAAGVYHRIAAIVTVFYWTAEMLVMVIMVLKARGKLQEPHPALLQRQGPAGHHRHVRLVLRPGPQAAVRPLHLLGEVRLPLSGGRHGHHRHDRAS